MRTKSVNNEIVADEVVEQDHEQNVLDARAILADADREELEQLRAERDARIATEKVIAEAELRAATAVTINLPPAAGRGIHVAGREYLHGHIYQVDNNTKWVLEEAERRCWAHESSLHESENKGRTKRRAFVG